MHRQSQPTCVAKIGGSLLDFEQLRAQLQKWLSRRATTKTIFVVGGGQRVERIRESDRRLPLGSSESHWKCIETMQLNASLVASWFPTWTLVNEFSELARIDSGHRVIFAPRNWLYALKKPLPETWDVTSDSIAARLAADLNADELVLFKSADPPLNSTVQSLIHAGYVDKYFSQSLQRRPVRLVNLRSSEMPELVVEQTVEKHV